MNYKIHILHLILIGVASILVSLSNVSATSMQDIMKAHNMTRQEAPTELNTPTMVNIQIISLHSCLHNSTDIPDRVCNNLLLQLPANCALINFNYCNDLEVKQYVDAHDFEGVEMYNKHVDLEKEMGISP